MGPGHKSSNALYAYKGRPLGNGYCSEDNHWFYGSDIKTEIYHRWYMKMPPASQFDKVLGVGSCKLWRYMLHANGVSRYGQLYLNFHNSKRLSTTQLTLFGGKGLFFFLKNTREFNDDQWHCHELRIKLNSKGNKDGIIEYWFDGVKAQSYTKINFRYDDRQPIAIHRFGVGMGNCSDEPWDQTQWSAIAFDDVVVSTEYVGPTDGGGSSPPFISNGN